MAYDKNFYLFPNDMNAVIAGLNSWGVHEGSFGELAVGPSSPQAMTVEVEAGVYRINNTFGYAAADTVTIQASESSPRKDIIVINSSGVMSAVKGTAATADPVGQSGPYTKAPEPPDIPANSIILAEVWVGAGVTAIYSSDITDRRVLLGNRIAFLPSSAAAYDLYYRGSYNMERIPKGSIDAALVAQAAGYVFKPAHVLAYESGGISLSSLFESIEGWNPEAYNGGTYSFVGGSCLELDTGTTLNGEMRIRKRPFYQARDDLSWDKGRRLIIGCALNNDTNQTLWLICGIPSSGRHFGFKVNGTSVSGTNGNGSTESATGIATITGANQHCRMEAVLYPSGSVNYYWNGVYQTTISGSLPSGVTDADYLFYASIVNAVAASRKVRLTEVRMIQEPYAT